MGEVYLAEETLLGRQVAIKRLNPSLTTDTQFAERFINEARIQAKLSHPNIVTLHNFFIEDGVYNMVLEYAAGITIKDLISQTGAIPEQRALYIFRQIMNALDYAHDKKIIHRDIKPSNIILDAWDNVKILDFGIALMLGERGITQTGVRIGTMCYMSPEQVNDANNVDAKTDIYSLGVTLFEMLTTQLPYNADTDSELTIMNKIVNEPLPDPRSIYPQISDGTASLIQAMTQKESNLRISGEEILRRLSAHLPIESSPIHNDSCGKIAAGNCFSLVVKTDGILAAWGLNDHGQCTFPVGNNFTAIAGGLSHCLALKSDGSMEAWGSNYSGQSVIQTGHHFTAIAAGRFHSLALKTDGSLISWGCNDDGQCDKQECNDFIAISAGQYHSLALKSNGSIIAWGANDHGQCNVPKGMKFAAIAAGKYFSIALKSDGSLIVWGDNRDGQYNVPVGYNFSAITAGAIHCLALKSDGSLVAWGDNSEGQCKVPVGNQFIAIAAGYFHNLAMKSDGSIVAWGLNKDGECNVAPTLGG